jgi:HAD superfamily hydrolase (TIGR01509 family)
MTYELVIFDCDGVLIDSEPIANRVLAGQLASIGIFLPLEEVMRKFVGRTRAGCLDLAAELLKRDLPEGFAEDWDTALFDAFERELKAIEGVADLLRALALPFCAASNSSPDRMRVSLRAADLLPFFEGRMYSATDVARPKPAPDLFLHAARSLGAAPERCAVIEDTPTGVRAGVAAGMTVFGYGGSAHSNSADLEREGARVFDHMSDLPALLLSRARCGSMDNG